MKSTPANRQKVIDRLKRRAAKEARAARVPAHMDCGRAMADAIRGTDTQGAARRCEALLSRLQRIDPHYPEGAM